MDILLLILHIVVCLALIGIVLLQGGKGAEVGATFGAGSSQTIFGASGNQTFLGKLTTGAAVIFMLTSLALAIFWGVPAAAASCPSKLPRPLRRRNQCRLRRQPCRPLRPRLPLRPPNPNNPLPTEESAGPVNSTGPLFVVLHRPDGADLHNDG